MLEFKMMRTNENEVTEITQSRGAEEMRAHLAAIVESSADAIISKTLEGIITSWNPSAERIFGYSAQEAVGKSMLMLFPEGRHDEELEIPERLKRGERTEHFETVRIRKDGQPIDVSVTLSPLRDGGGRVIGVSKIARDITDRKNTERAAAQLAAIVQSSDDAIIGKDLNNIITSWNRGAERLFGYPSGEMLGTSIMRLISPEHRQQENDILESVKHGQSMEQFETVRQTKDGRSIHVSVTASPIQDTGGKIVGVSKVARDITVRKQMELALRESEERFRTMANSMAQLAWIARADGFIVWYNRRWYEYTGTTPEQMEGWGWQSVHAPDSLPNVLIAWKAAIAARQVFDMEFPLRGADGIYRTFLSRGIPVKDPAGQVQQWFGTNTDISERKEAEEKVKGQLARVALFNQIARAIGNRLDLNSILQIVCNSLEDNLPVDFSCACTCDEPANTLEVVRVGTKSEPTAIASGLIQQSVIPMDENLSRCVMEQLVYEPDTSRVPFPFSHKLARVGLRSLVMAPLRVEGTVFGVLVVARRQAQGFVGDDCDFLKQLSEHVALASHQSQLYSALQQAYDDLRQSQQILMQQERLRTLGQMASGIAHDINNAISPVMLYTESLLETEPDLSARARDYLQTIRQATRNVAATVARIREFYRQREPQLTLTRVDLNHAAQHVVALTRARWSDQAQHRGVVIEMLTQLVPGLPAIMGVESEIHGALTNLVLNAVDAMPDGGILTLRTLTEKNLHGSGQAPGLCRTYLEVIDTGVGMDEVTRRRCLEPFYTTKGERGTGLGLAMVYGMIQRHSAEIAIESTPGKGTTVRLGFHSAPTVSFGGSQHPELSAVAPRLRILIVDDDPLVLKSLRATLQMDGHQVVTANGGQAGIEAFHLAGKTGEPFAVVITDLGMPCVDGHKVASAVKSASASTPLILLTGWGQRLEAQGGVPRHVDRLLSKPPTLRDLREALACCCPNTNA
jgi:PAS domain S-box-containing protein